MLKYIFLLFLGFNFLSSNENSVKTSELELFLFKIGFESLLKDVEINKDKTTLNEKEIKVINEKINLIMTELYKKNQVLLNDSKENSKVEVVTKIDNQELQKLKEEIAFLKETILQLKKTEESPKIIDFSKSSNYRIISEEANIYEYSYQESSILKTLKRGEIIEVNSCNKYGWCKIENEKGFIKEFLIRQNNVK